MRKILVVSIVLALSTAGCAPAGPSAFGGPNNPVATWNRLSPEQREWALSHPDAARKLGELSPEERGAVLEQYRNLPPDLQQQIREHPEAYMK